MKFSKKLFKISKMVGLMIKAVYYTTLAGIDINLDLNI